MEHASFNPAHTTPHSTIYSSPQTPTRPVCHCLSFNSNSDWDPDSTSVHSNSSDDNQDLDSTPVYSDIRYLSDISDYEDYMMTTSDDDKIPGMEGVPY